MFLANVNVATTVFYANTETSERVYYLDVNKISTLEINKFSIFLKMKYIGKNLCGKNECNAQKCSIYIKCYDTFFISSKICAT